MAPPKISLPNVKQVIAVASGKGGVGKSTVALNLAVSLSKNGAKVGLLDADVYGPSIPLMIGKNEKPFAEGNQLIPIEKNGIQFMSMGFLVDDTQPVVWRGPMVHGILTQFLTQVNWGELDVLFIDMPPGTGDAQLTISQNAPLTGAIIVTTPQEVSLIDARRGLKMFQSVNVPILGIVENMSGFTCSHCHEVTHLFQEGGGERFSKEYNVPLLGKIPLDPQVSAGGDKGLTVVEAHPESEVAKVYQQIAGKVAYEVSNQVLNHPQAPGLHLEWQA